MLKVRKHQPDSWIRMVGILMLVVVPACDIAESVSVNHVRMQKCDVTFDDGFPTDGDFKMTMPANCPFMLGGATTLDYAATASFPANEVAYGPGFYQLNFIDRLGSDWGSSGVQSSWSQDGVKYLFSAQGTYVAARGGFDSSDNGFDTADNQFYTTQNGWKSALGTLSYKFGIPQFYVHGVSNGPAFGSYELTGFTDDPTFHGPPTYEWWVDGTLVSTDPVLDWQAGAEGTVQSIAGKVFDIDGRSHTGWYSFTACTDNQIQC